MIVDVHSHTPRYREAVPEVSRPREGVALRPDRPTPRGYTWEQYAEVMRPVDRAIVLNIAMDPAPTVPPESSEFLRLAREVNDETAAFVRAHGGKLIGFLSVHPRDPECLEEIERGVSDLGLRGVKLGPNYQNFDPLSEGAFRIYRRAQELKLPVLFHQGTSPTRFADLDYAHPRHADRLATAFPDLKIVLAHMGHPWQADCIAVVRKHPNVYADVSALFYREWSHYSCMRLATEWSILPKLLFASDFPAATPQETMDGMRRVNAILEGTRLPRVPEDAIEQIIHRNSLELLGLE
jgi:predicted TIM-barrel fold metal-dependent hydrolase